MLEAMLSRRDERFAKDETPRTILFFSLLVMLRAAGEQGRDEQRRPLGDSPASCYAANRNRRA
jgi:hypothetical protein